MADNDPISQLIAAAEAQQAETQVTSTQTETISTTVVAQPQPPAQQIDYNTVKRGPDGVVFVVGGEEITVPPLTFWALSRCAAEFQVATEATNMIDRVGACLRVMSSSLALTEWRKADRARLLSETESIPWIFDQLSKKLRGNEWVELSKAYGVLLVESGLLDGDAFYNAVNQAAAAGEPPKGEVTTPAGGPALLSPSSDVKADTPKPNGFAQVN